MSVMILGVGGFVGGWIERSLRRGGHQTFSLSRATSPGRQENGFLVGPDGDFNTSALVKYFEKNQIQHVIHCANNFSRYPSVSVATQMLDVNFGLPAKVLRVAIETCAKSFINLGSAWQLDPNRQESFPDYAWSKEAFRTYLHGNSGRIQAWTIFVNEIFAAHDPRPKLLNHAIRCLNNQEILEVNSERSELGFAFLPRLADEVHNLISGEVNRPSNYLYENYSKISVREILSLLQKVGRGTKFWTDTGLTPDLYNVSALPVAGTLDKRTLERDLESLFFACDCSAK